MNIVEYIRDLTRKYKNIESVWLYGSRANDSYNDKSDWDLFVFANRGILEALKSDARFHDESIDLCVVYNGEDWENPYPDINGRTKGSSLRYNFQWEQESEREASYVSRKYKDEKEWFKGGSGYEEKVLRAVKIWP